MVLSDSDGYDDDIDENIDYDMDIFDNKENEIQVKQYHQSNVNWTGDEVNDPNPPQVPFKESSDLMNRHAERYLQKPMNLVYHKNSDGGRRTKVVNIPFPFKEYDGYTTSESEYESPDEDWYYDPRQISKWKWETDFTSVHSDCDSSSSKSDDELSYKESKFF